MKNFYRYGLPYMGSKNFIAQKIIDALPAGKCLVDLFAGGCAITHAALMAGKWERIIANDICDAPKLFKNAINGKYKNESRWISRADFFALKDTDPYVRYCWSFGNQGGSYMYSPEIEGLRKLQWEMCFADTPYKRKLWMRQMFLYIYDMGLLLCKPDISKGKTLILNADVPDDGEYKTVLFAKYTSEVCRPDQFSAGEFEGRILPQAANLVAAKKITQKECDLFTKSYFFVEENSRYYFDDDQFASARNAAVAKVLRLFEERYSNSILDVNIKAAGDYKGFGEGIVKYPTQYLSYGKTTNAALISPLAGVLRRGEEADFAVTSGDYTALAVHDGSNLTPMTRDAKTGEFVLNSYVIGDSAEKIIVYGSNDGRKYDGLWFYEVVQ